ncbi:MAG: TrkA C-terminal domain-containing protein [Thermodesulfovibrionales bacterium]|nr:TrkA C-terminal domain-containing protein [Thermodesulfovibrionales bacterium]
MSGLYFLLPTLFAIFISFLIVRSGAIALMMTGVDRPKAVFQALSAFTGTGFTTREAETVVNNPLRRKIIGILMILGNAGIVAVIISATSSVVTSKGYELPIHFILFLVGVFLIYRIGKSRGFVQKWESFIQRKLVKIPAFEEEDAEDILHFLEGYGLIKKTVSKNSQLIGVLLAEWKFRSQDVIILGIERDRKWLPIPSKHHQRVQEGDKLVLYGNLNSLREILDE